MNATLQRYSMEFPTFDELFAPLIGLPCWNVKQGYGTFLTMEFGQPQQEIHRVMKLKSARFPSRTVTIRGEWHLWIYCCRWKIEQAGEELANYESTADVIAWACRVLDGQMLTAFSAQPVGGKSRFLFDLGGTLETEKWDEFDDEADDKLYEQWMMYCPDGNVFTYRSDGRVNFKPGSGHGSDDETWLEAK